MDPGRIVRGELGDDVLAQAAVADVLVANRVDLASELELELFRSWTTSLWPGPHAVHETSFGEVPAEALLDWPPGTGPRALEIPPVERSTGHGFRVRTFRFAPDVVFHRGRLLEAIGTSAAERIKGVFRTDEGTILLQVAGGTLSESPSGRRSDGRIDVIVPADRADLLSAAEADLDRARLRPEEVRRRGTTLEVALPDGRVRPFDRASLASLPAQVPDVSALVPDRHGSRGEGDRGPQRRGGPRRGGGGGGGGRWLHLAAGAPGGAGLRRVAPLDGGRGPAPGQRGGPFGC